MLDEPTMYALVENTPQAAELYERRAFPHGSYRNKVGTIFVPIGASTGLYEIPEVIQSLQPKTTFKLKLQERGESGAWVSVVTGWAATPLRPIKATARPCAGDWHIGGNFIGDQIGRVAVEWDTRRFAVQAERWRLAQTETAQVSLVRQQRAIIGGSTFDDRSLPVQPRLPGHLSELSPALAALWERMHCPGCNNLHYWMARR